jgi:phenylacetate-CoA ligase
LWKSLEASQWLPRPALLERQRTQLNQLLRDALQHSPWHAHRLREAELERPVLENTLEIAQLQNLPTMDKADARAHREAMVWHAVPGGAHRYTTGGSSGEPLIFYFGRDRQAADAAARFRGRGWWGIKPGARELYLWGAPVELGRNDRLKSLRDSLVNHRILNAFTMSASRMDEYLAIIGDWRPESIYGYASSLALLAAHARSRGRQPVLPELKVVCTTGEPLYPHQRALIQEAFGVPVANEYGCRDGGLIAHESPGGQMLLTDECCLVEVLDAAGQPVPPGVEGELVLTGLYSKAQPFIRYRTGDRVTLAGKTASNGCSLSVLGEIAGRQTDYVVRSDGTVMHALSLIYVLRERPGVAAFKCIQHSPTYVEVMIVPTPEWSSTEAEAIRAGLRLRLGEVEINLQMRDEIPPEASGKYRYVVSHVGLPSRYDGLLPAQA